MTEASDISTPSASDLSKSLSDVAKKKRTTKRTEKWTSLSVIGRKKPRDLNISSTQGDSPSSVIKRKKNAGGGTSKLGFVIGKIFGKNSIDVE